MDTRLLEIATINANGEDLDVKTIDVAIEVRRHP
jgi:hypothetical protein